MWCIKHFLRLADVVPPPISMLIYDVMWVWFYDIIIMTLLIQIYNLIGGARRGQNSTCTCFPWKLYINAFFNRCMQRSAHHCFPAEHAQTYILLHRDLVGVGARLAQDS